MTHWIIEKFGRFTDVGSYRISESFIRAYTYVILSSQSSVRLHIISNTSSVLTAQKAFMNNFENIVNCRVDIWEDIKCYQDGLSYTLSKADYSVGEGIYMLPSDMSLKVKSRTAGHNNGGSLYLMVHLVWAGMIWSIL